MNGLKWETLIRFQLIEIIAFWEGRLTTTHLMNSFKIGRQQASSIIKEYMKGIAPNNLEYDAHLKGYKPTPSFDPKVTCGIADEYLQLISQPTDLIQRFSPLDLNFTHAEIATPIKRSVSPDVLKAIVNATNRGFRLDVGYVSVNNPDEEGRIIAPHTLICTNSRWHVRAYCEKNKDYRDFVLSRLRGIPDELGPSTHSARADVDWNTYVELTIVPNPDLSVAQKKVISEDYQMINYRHTIKCRAALLPYTLQAYEIDPHSMDQRPEAQQLTVEDWDSIRAYIGHLIN